MQVADIAALALDAAQGAITDAVHPVTLTHGAGTDTGRGVVLKERPASEFSTFKPSQSAQLIMLEGLTTAPTDGDTVTLQSRDYFVIRVQDIVAAGSVFNVQAIPQDELFTAAISIERKTQVATGSGGFTDTWTEIGTPDAYFAAQTGREAYNADHMQSDNKFRCIIPYRADGNGAPFYSGKDRIIYQGRTYAVEAVVDMSGRGKWLEMMLTEGGAT